MRNLLPKATWALIQQQPDALFVDVRMEIESLYVGRPPGVHIIAWYEYPDLAPHPMNLCNRWSARRAAKTARWF